MEPSNKNKTKQTQNLEEENASDVQGKVAALDIKTENKTKLGGAARKRLKRLRKQGHNPEEAQQLALKPMVKSPNKVEKAKKRRSDDSFPVPNMGKKHKSTYTADPIQHVRIHGVSYKMIAGSVKLAIISEDYPKSLISEAQRRTLLKLKFLSSKFKTGWMVIVCANDKSAEWLRANLKEVKLWKGAKLKLVEESEFPQEHTIIGRFPNSSESSI